MTRHPAVGGYSRALHRDDLIRHLDEIAQDLPVDGGIRIEFRISPTPPVARL
jgi:hypothetical protein